MKRAPEAADLALDELVIDGILDAGRVAALHLKAGDHIGWYGDRTVAEVFPAGRQVHVRMVDGDEFTFGSLATFGRTEGATA